uniref:Uncharacterized protein n=1 Tax=Globisporangium ultimum (strain ATCC 200006 / CBS 805.95 / DAOM BR144) TaxID=431595 RepID=K3XCX2_GLOUD
MGITHASKSETSDVVGYIVDTISVLLYASPFATPVRVIKTKSVATIRSRWLLSVQSATRCG